MPVVRTDGRAGGRLVYGHVITKFSRMGSLPHFVTHGAPLRASRARAPLIYSCYLIMKFAIHSHFQNETKSKAFLVKMSLFA